MARLGSATRRLDGLGGLGWSVIGFLLGAVFWHFVGFWGFVSDVVLAGHSAVVIADKAPPAAGADSWAAKTEVATAVLPASSCISLALDRRTGRTSAVACAAEAGSLPADTFEGREDRVQAAASADTWVAPHGPPGALGTIGPQGVHRGPQTF